MSAQGYQAFTQATGLLGLTDARDAFLTSLCSFTLGGSGEEPLSPGGPRNDAHSPTAAGAHLAWLSLLLWQRRNFVHLNQPDILMNQVQNVQHDLR